MQENTETEVQKVGGSGSLGLIAMFIAGVSVAATVAVIAARSQSDKADNVLHACDKAIKTLERRMQAIDVALAG